MAIYKDVESLEAFCYESDNEEFDKGVRFSLEKLDALPTADVVEVKKIEIIRDDLIWWLETNTEKGVVHIPKYFVENMIAKMDGGKAG